MPESNQEGCGTVAIEASNSLLRLIAGLVFGRGVEVEGRAGSSVFDFLCGQLQLAKDYVENRIQTVFLDGKPVDDLRSATLAPGSTLALSAAMPGLVGAVFRRGGYYAPLRDSITYRNGTCVPPTSEKRIVLKLFNMTAREIGPQILGRGVWIDGLRITDLVQTLGEDFRRGCRRFRIDGEPVDCQQLLKHSGSKDSLYFRASAND